ncbi:unnamed protein product [Periconia digitata]|uniref:Uncharacterized protein n=1 Tax=Periconia digitata TaxID=1303443 RepID=A0A9W4XYU9_9PLEO|nr:unnamed protein product [Periconia digitata]
MQQSYLVRSFYLAFSLVDLDASVVPCSPARTLLFSSQCNLVFMCLHVDSDWRVQPRGQLRRRRQQKGARLCSNASINSNRYRVSASEDAVCAYLDC